MKHVYLDYAAATPIDSKALGAMLPFLRENFGNPSSFHTKGKDATDAIKNAREKIAESFGAREDEIVFTSGGTESDNLAVLGFARANTKAGRHIVTTAIEHPAVLEAVKQLEKKEGFEVARVGVDGDGLVKPEDILNAVRQDTILVSVMLANNEIGTIQQVEEIGRRLPDHVAFHTDACQAAGALELNVEKLHVDMLTLNGSKIYGPKGVGALYVRRGIKLEPLQFGGAQEKSLRGGTENVAGIVGLAKALEIARAMMKKENERQSNLRDYLIKRILAEIPKTRLNGHASKRLPNNVNISFADVEGEALLLYLDAVGIYASTGSACTSASLDPSHVVMALGVPFEIAHSSIRFSLGRGTTKKDIDYVMTKLPVIVEKLRKMSSVELEIGTWKRKI
jgi:cysteine desulfurase